MLRVEMPDLRRGSIKHDDTASRPTPAAGFGAVHFVNFSRKFATNSVFFLVPLYFVSRGFSGWQIGVIMACYAIAPLLFSFPSGWLSDRFSAGRVIRACLILMGFCLLCLGRLDGFVVFSALFLLLGLANNGLDVSTNAYMYKDQKALDQNRKYGTYAFWLALGAAAGTALGGAIVHVADFRTLFTAYGIAMLIVRLGYRPPESMRAARISIKEYRFDLWNRKTLAFSFLIFLLSLHWGAEGTVYAPFLKEHFSLNPLQVSAFISLPLGILALSALAVGRLRFHESRNRRLFAAALAVSGLGHVLMVQNDMWIALVFRIVHEIGDGIMGALLVLFVSRLFSQRSIGGSSGVLLMVMTLGHMLGSLIFSHLGFRYGLQIPFLVSGLILIFDALFAMHMFRTQRY